MESSKNLLVNLVFTTHNLLRSWASVEWMFQ